MIIKSILFIILIILFASSCYLLYTSIMDLTAKQVQFVAQPQNTTPASKNQPSFSSQSQFFPNMRFARTGITYSIDTLCKEDKKQKAEQAFKALEQETSILRFSQLAFPEGEIVINCDESKIEENISEEYYTAGEGGPLSIINTSAFYIIENGTVILIYNKSQCDNYNVELHEILHVFGFKHSDNNESIMYRINYCNQVLTDDIIKELKRLYSILPLPDLYMTNASATKQGNYLNFNIEMRNKGLSTAENIKLELSYNNDTIEFFDIEDMDYGKGKFLEVENLKLPSKQVSKIKFTLQAGTDLNPDDNSIELVLAS